MTRLNYLEMKNFMMTGSKVVHLEFLRDKVVVFKGDIGSGKSTIIDATSVALFGKTYSDKDINSIINRTNGGKTYLGLSFHDSKDDEYLVERWFKPDKHKLTVKKKGSEKFEPVPYTGKVGLNEKVSQLLNIDRKIFDQTVFISNKFSKPFMELDSKQKKEFLKRVFNQERYEKMSDLAKEKVKEKKFEVASVNGKIELLKEQKTTLETQLEEKQKNDEETLREKELDLDISKDTISDIEKERIVIDKEKVESFNKRKDEAIADKATAESELKIKEEDRVIASERREKSKVIVSVLEEKKSSLNESEMLKIDDYDKNQSEGFGLSELGSKIKKEYEELGVKEEESKKNSAKVEELKNKISELETDLHEKCSLVFTFYGDDESISDGRNPSERIEALKENIINKKVLNQRDEIDLNKKLSIAESAIREKKQEIFTHREKIEYYKTTNICSECGNVISGKYSEKNISELESKITGIELKIEPLMKDYKTFEEGIDRIDKSKTKIQRTLRMIDEFGEIEKKFEDTKEEKREVEKKFDGIDRDFDALRKEKREKMREIKEDLQEISRKILAHKKNVKIKEEIAEKELELSVIGEIADDDKLVKEIEKISHDVSICDDVLNVCTAFFIEHEKNETTNRDVEKRFVAENENYKKILEKIEDLSKSIKNPDRSSIISVGRNIEAHAKSAEQANREIDMLEKLVEAVGDNGIKKYIVGKYLSMLNQICEKYLTSINAIHGVVFTNKKGLSGEIVYRGNVIPYRSLSNGQSQQINLAILFTFIEFLRVKNNSNFPLIFLDEMFDSSMSPESLRKSLEQVRSNIPYVNIITHKMENLEMADKIIQVDNDSGFSKYSDVTNGSVEILEKIGFDFVLPKKEEQPEDSDDLF